MIGTWRGDDAVEEREDERDRVGTKGLLGDLESLSRPKEAISSTKGGRVVIALTRMRRKKGKEGRWQSGTGQQGVKRNICLFMGATCLRNSRRSCCQRQQWSERGFVWS